MSRSSQPKPRLEYTDESETHFYVFNLSGKYFKFKNTIKTKYKGTWVKNMVAWKVQSKYLEGVADLLDVDEVFEAERKDSYYPKPPELDYLVYIEYAAKNDATFWIRGPGLHEEYDNQDDDDDENRYSIKEGLIKVFGGKFSSYNHGVNVNSSKKREVERWIGKKNISKDPEGDDIIVDEDTDKRAYRYVVSLLNDNYMDFNEEFGMGLEEMFHYAITYKNKLAARGKIFE